MNEPVGLVALTGQAIALKGVEVSARIASLVAETTLEQRYQNDTRDNLEVAYTFPLPVDGVLLDFQATLGERTLKGRVIPRKEAESQYEAAVEAGDAAFRLQKVRDGLYTATLGNLLPGETVTICVRYGEVLRWQGGRLRYRLPTAIAPRYGEPEDMQPWQRPQANLLAAYSLKTEIRILGPLARARFHCATHRTSFSTVDGETVVTLAGDAWLDRDFVLEIQPGSEASMGLSAQALESRVGLVSLLPERVPVDPTQGRDCVLVVDCSGSMAGDSIEQAKRGLHLCLQSLNPADRFAVLAFGSTTLPFHPGLLPSNRKNLQLAKAFVDDLPGLGGTELGAALDRAMAYADGRPLDILLLTDGEVWNLDDAHEKARQGGHRIFALGIGSAVAEDTLRQLADRTGGACELVTPNEDMGDRVLAHFGRMRQPRIESLAVDWGTSVSWTAQPDTALFAGDACLVWAGLEGNATLARAELRLAGGTAGSESIPLESHSGLADTLVRLAAQARLKSLPESERQAWAVRYQLVTDETDCLVVAERAAAEKAAGLPELQVVPQMLAAGWGGTGTVQFSMRQPSVAPVFHAMALDFPGTESYEIGEPPVIRFSPTRPATSALGDGWDRFIASLDQAATQGLPENLVQLVACGLPMELLPDLIALLDQDVTEADVVHAFIALLPEFLQCTYPGVLRQVLKDSVPASIKALVLVRARLVQLDEFVWKGKAARGPDAQRNLQFETTTQGRLVE